MSLLRPTADEICFFFFASRFKIHRTMDSYHRRLEATLLYLGNGNEN